MFARYWFWLSILWLTVSFRTGLSEEMISETQKFSYPFTSDSRFQLSNQNGSVQIVGDDSNEVRIEAIKKAHSQSELAAIHVSVEQKDKAIALGDGANPIQLRTVNGTIQIRTKG
jgi:hypothetical protein